MKIKNIFITIIGILIGLVCSFEMVASAEESQEDKNPMIAHYELQLMSLQAEVDELTRENEELKRAAAQPNPDYNNDGVVSIVDAVILLKYIAEIS